MPEKPPNMSEAKPHLLFHGFSGKIGTRVKTILQALFPVPGTNTTRNLAFVNTGNDLIQFRHHSFVTSPNPREEVQLTEIGPRFDMRLYRIELGTLEMPDVKIQWALRPFMNKQRKILDTAEPQEEDKAEQKEGEKKSKRPKKSKI